jgi:Protein of unknown function (DUF1501)
MLQTTGGKMLSIVADSPSLCDGFSRRTMLRAGAVAGLGLRPSAKRVGAAQPRPTAKRCMLLFLLGGPPQHSTWDPKPEAPAEIRGEIDSIATTVPGVRIGELLPRTALLMDRVALLRAVVTGDNAHSSSGYFMMTGVPHAPQNRENANPGPPNDWPTMAAVAQHLAGPRRLLPAGMRLPHHIFNTDGSVWPGQDSGWLGHAADPWLLNCEPASEDYRVPQFQLAADLSLDRLSRRRSLLAQIDSLRQSVETSSRFGEYGGLQDQAFDLLSSASARAACDLTQEPQDIRDRYGRYQFGQSVLLGRRLLEAGVQFVQVNWFRGPDEPSNAPCWDSHAGETRRLRQNLLPPFDLAYSALLEDLTQRGLLEETLVVCMAEFGRSPRFNAQGGRDHWGSVFSIALAGGGIRGGLVHGRSDEQAAFPEEGVVTPADITATIFHCLGHAPDELVYDPLGRPHPISRGNVIQSLL